MVPRCACHLHVTEPPLAPPPPPPNGKRWCRRENAVPCIEPQEASRAERHRGAVAVPQQCLTGLSSADTLQTLRLLPPRGYSAPPAPAHAASHDHAYTSLLETLLVVAIRTAHLPSEATTRDQHAYSGPSETIEARPPSAELTIHSVRSLPCGGTLPPHPSFPNLPPMLPTHPYHTAHHLVLVSYAPAPHF